MLINVFETMTSGPEEFFNLSDMDIEKMKSDTLIAFRYFTKLKALDFLATGEIYMAHPSQWEDPFEGELYMYWGLITGRGHLTDHMKSLCLSEDPESDLIWKCYCQDNSGIKIGFKVNALAAEINANVLGRVLYIDRINALDIIDNQLEKIPTNHSHKLIFTKQRAYEGERELRILKFDEEENAKKPFRVKVKLSDCIESITINPRASEEDASELTAAIKSQGLDMRIKQSTYLGRDWDYMLTAARKYIRRTTAMDTPDEV
ncbi:DUF2971 domain-containing protein [Methylobacter sp.]|uniref:DUF2971 domain-containing protein n=1 Tax=Methylobacter sp. TaxID=2051955 RepID=UPI002FDD68D5